MNFSGVTWAKILEAMTKASGKELIFASAPILLAIPGFLDELAAGFLALGLVAVFLGLRWHVNNHSADIERLVRAAQANKMLSATDAMSALSNLRELSTSR